MHKIVENYLSTFSSRMNFPEKNKNIDLNKSLMLRHQEAFHGSDTQTFLRNLATEEWVRIYSEKLLQHPYLTEIYGTCDIISINSKDKVIKIIDFKSGAIPVEVNKNAQLHVYATLFLLSNSDYDIEDYKVKLIILQSTDFKSVEIKEADFTEEDFETTVKLLNNSYDVLLNPEKAEAVSSEEACKYCELAPYCKKNQERTLGKDVVIMDENNNILSGSNLSIELIKDNIIDYTPEQKCYIVKASNVLEKLVKLIKEKEREKIACGEELTEGFRSSYRRITSVNKKIELSKKVELINELIKRIDDEDKGMIFDNTSKIVWQSFFSPKEVDQIMEEVKTTVITIKN